MKVKNKTKVELRNLINRRIYSWIAACSLALPVTSYSVSETAEYSYNTDGELYNAKYLSIGEVSYAPLTSGNIGAITTTVENNDSDKDTLPDSYEQQYGLNPNNAADAAYDLDSDGLSNLQEFEFGTRPDRKDSNGDGYSDRVAYTLADLGGQIKATDRVKVGGSDKDYTHGEAIELDLPPYGTKQPTPVLTIPADLTVASTGPLTPISLGVATANDFRGKAISFFVDNRGPFEPGRHAVIWRAKGTTGQEIHKTQYINVIPQVSVVAPEIVAEGNTLILKAVLNGASVADSVRIPFMLSGSASAGTDYTISAREFILNNGQQQASLSVPIKTDSQTEGPETLKIQLQEPEGAVLAQQSSAIISLVEGNVIHTGNIRINQNNRQVSQISTTDGQVVMTAQVQDPNAAQSYSFDWSDTSSFLSPQEGYLNETFTFSPAGLAAGTYSLAVEVEDDAGNSVELLSALRVINNHSLSNTEDADSDGKTDAEEGLTDTDGDRIPDYLDRYNQSNVLQIDKAHNGRIMQSLPGTRLRLGERALSEEGFADIKERLLSNEQDPEDYNFLSWITDFEITELGYGANTQVVIPQSVEIPQDAVYRKFEQTSGWKNFIEDTENRVESAPGTLNNCPPAGSTEYEPGLTPGHHCVQLTLQDGGPNDADGQANGAIKDPGGVASQYIATPHVEITASTPGNTIRRGGGEQTVMHLVVTSSTPDAMMNSLTVNMTAAASALGDISSVRLYLDSNNDDTPDSNEKISEIGGELSAGDLLLTFEAPLPLSTNSIKLLLVLSI